LRRFVSFSAAIERDSVGKIWRPYIFQETSNLPSRDNAQWEVSIFHPLRKFFLTMPTHSQKHLWKNFFLGLVLIVPALIEVAWRYPFALRARYKVNRALRNWEKDSKERRGRYRT
jgi:hypothetical protein